MKLATFFRRPCRSAVLAPGFLALPALLLAGSATNPPSFVIQTIVGTATAGFTGDSGPANAAELYAPFSLAISGNNMYIADQVNNRIRLVTGGNINTVAGNGTGGFSGDNGQAQKAELFSPVSVLVDSSGNLYIADSANFVVRKVTTTGVITTYAGLNSAGAGYSGDSGTAVTAQLATPSGLAIDKSGNLYIADSTDNVIREVSGTAPNNISTFAGDSIADYQGDGGPATSASLNNPCGLAIDSAGNLYIADSSNNAIRKVDISGNITTIAGLGVTQAGYSGDGGLATAARLNHPQGVAVDSSGNVYIADTFNHRVRVVVALTGQIFTVAGNGAGGYTGDGGPAITAQLLFPAGVATDTSGNVYIADTQNNVIRELTPGAPGTALPTILANGISTASGFGGFTSAAPGSWIEIYGANLGLTTYSWQSSDFSGLFAPQVLVGTQVFVGGQQAFVEYVSSNQVNALLPSTIGPGMQSISVVTPYGTSQSVQLKLNETQPGLLAPTIFNLGGTQYVGALFADGVTYALPTGAVSGVPSRPAHPGDTLVLYGVGFGPVTPNALAGEIVTQSNTLLLPIRVFFGQTEATVFYQGLSPGSVGLYQFNLVVPNITASNALPLTFTQNGTSGSQTLYIAVGN